MAERKKAREAEAASAPAQATTKKQKRGRGRPPKTAAEQTKELVLQKAKELDSSDSSDSDSNSSSDQSVSDDDNSSDSSDDNKQPKIKPSGVSMVGKKKTPAPLKSPPGKAKIRKNSTASNNDLKSPEKNRRDSIVSG